MRRRYVQQADGTLVEVPLDYVAPRNRVWSDAWMDGLRAPDGTDIGTRTKVRRYMKTHNLAHYDEIKPDIERAQKAREAEFSASRVPDLQRAFEQVRSGYKPRLRSDE